MDRPILFSAPMVRALLAGTKTQTRRIMKPQPELQMNGFYHLHNAHGGLVNVAEEDIGKEAPDYLRIAVGDRLWVRESWRPVGDAALSECTGPEWLTFMATDDEALAAQVKYRPSIHMPRWGSRLTLHVTDVRVQRLQEIDEADAEAEGIERLPGVGWRAYADQPRPFSGAAPTVLSGGRGIATSDPRHAYATLWENINGAGSWGKNPWIAAYTFTVEHANIDQARAA